MSALSTSIAAWRMAVKNRRVAKGLIFQSDRGIHYAFNEFANLLESYEGVQRSMSRKGNCWDNAVAESFFKSIKVEHVYRQRFTSKEEAGVSIFEWIESWYNHHRRHSALGNLTINKFNQLAKINNAA